jgi:uncharacterized protein DUF4194
MVWLSGRKSQEAKEGRIGMDFLTDFGQFEPAQRERFQQVVTRLLQGDVLVPGPAMRPDPDWRFTERNRDLIDGYLRFGGWRLDIDLGLRLARAVHESGAQRVRFNKLESLLLCTLRLIYHEQMRQVSEEVRCELKIGDLRERLIQSGKPPGLLSRRTMADAIRRLARHSLIAVERGFAGEDEELIVVNPVIEKVLPPDKIADIAERVRNYVGPVGESSEEDREELADPAAVPDDEEEAE